MKCSAVCWPDGPKREIQHRHSRYMKCINRESVNKDNSCEHVQVSQQQGRGYSSLYTRGPEDTPALCFICFFLSVSGFALVSFPMYRLAILCMYFHAIHMIQ